MKTLEANIDKQMFGFDLKSNSSNSLVLMLHRQMGNYFLGTRESYGLTVQHFGKTLYTSVFDTKKLTTHSGPGQHTEQNTSAELLK